MCVHSRDVPYNIVFFTSYIGIKRGLTDADGNIGKPVRLPPHTHTSLRLQCCR